MQAKTIVLEKERVNNYSIHYLNMASPDRPQPFSRLLSFFNRNKAPADPVGIGENNTGKLVDEFGREVDSLDELQLIGEIAHSWPLRDVNGNIFTRSNRTQEVVPNQDENNP